MYCANADVQAEFKSINFAAAGALVTGAKVDEWIKQADAFINAHVGMRYTVPVPVGSDAESLLKLFSVSLVAGRVRNILRAKGGDVEQTGGSGMMGTKEVKETLEQIKSGEMALSGAVPLVASTGFFSSSNDEEREPTFHKNVSEW